MNTTNDAIAVAIERRAAEHAAGCMVCQAAATATVCQACRHAYASPEELAVHLVEVHGGFAAAPFPGHPGYVIGACGHPVATHEWEAGWRVCEHCPDPLSHVAALREAGEAFPGAGVR